MYHTPIKNPTTLVYATKQPCWIAKGHNESLNPQKRMQKIEYINRLIYPWNRMQNIKPINITLNSWNRMKQIKSKNKFISLLVPCMDLDMI